jgi:hypothetical protein
MVNDMSCTIAQLYTLFETEVLLVHNWNNILRMILQIGSSSYCSLCCKLAIFLSSVEDK